MKRPFNLGIPGGNNLGSERFQFPYELRKPPAINNGGLRGAQSDLSQKINVRFRVPPISGRQVIEQVTLPHVAGSGDITPGMAIQAAAHSEPNGNGADNIVGKPPPPAGAEHSSTQSGVPSPASSTPKAEVTDSSSALRVGTVYYQGRLATPDELQVLEAEMSEIRILDYGHLLAIRKITVVTQAALEQAEDFHRISEIPLLKQRHTYWCGYTTLAMSLHQKGYPDLTPESIFRFLHEGEYDRSREVNAVKASKAPNVDRLAQAALEMTNGEIRADRWDEEKYEALNRKRLLAGKEPSTPFDLLNSYLTKVKTPVIVRFPGHYNIVTGVNSNGTIYSVYDPLSAEEYFFPKSVLDSKWRIPGKFYNPDDTVTITRYAMLALRGKRSK